MKDKSINIKKDVFTVLEPESTINKKKGGG